MKREHSPGRQSISEKSTFHSCLKMREKVELDCVKDECKDECAGVGKKTGLYKNVQRQWYIHLLQKGLLTCHASCTGWNNPKVKVVIQIFDIDFSPRSLHAYSSEPICGLTVNLAFLLIVSSATVKNS